MVAGVLQRPDGTWLMHRRPLHKHHGGLWEFPGGKVEEGETPAIALFRELQEELGIAIEAAGIQPLAFAQEWRADSRTSIVILLYKVAAWVGEPHAREDGAAIEWFAEERIALLERPPLDHDLCAQIFSKASAENDIG